MKDLAVVQDGHVARLIPACFRSPVTGMGNVEVVSAELVDRSAREVPADSELLREADSPAPTSRWRCVAIVRLGGTPDPAAHDPEDQGADQVLAEVIDVTHCAEA